MAGSRDLENRKISISQLRFRRLRRN